MTKLITTVTEKVEGREGRMGEGGGRGEGGGCGGGGGGGSTPDADRHETTARSLGRFHICMQND